MARAGNLDEDTISIHAPRMRSDCKPPDERFAPLYFNPRSPHEERLLDLEQHKLEVTFQSTLPA